LKGTYTLVMACEEPFRVKIGKIGHAHIEKGFFLYTGSALGRGGASLERRIERHYRKGKQVRWHVDFLTVRPEISIKKTVCLKSLKRVECRINQLIISELRGKPVILHVGATDCKCDGHLLSVGVADVHWILIRLQQVYSNFGNPIILDTTSKSDFSALFPSNAKSILEYSD
jgi:Uri superfamily endonuclease